MNDRPNRSGEHRTAVESRKAAYHTAKDHKLMRIRHMNVLGAHMLQLQERHQYCNLQFKLSYP